MHLPTPSIFRNIARLFILLIPASLFSQETLSVSVLNGTEIRCYPDSLVRIEITPNTDFAFTQIVVSWGDNMGVFETINPGDPLILEHEYPLAQFLEECAYGQGCPPFAASGFCFNLTIDASYGEATPAENISKRITFQFPPRPDFAPDNGYICAGDEVLLQNATCPENDPTMRYYWTFPEGPVLTDEDPTYPFQDPGSYPVTLTAVNGCDSVSFSKNVTVRELPIASAVLDSGSIATEDSVYIVCLSAGGKVRLNGDSSTFSTSYEWTFSPSTGVIPIIGINNDTACIQFTEEGLYTATLTVDNPCEAPDQVELQIEVIAPVTLSLQPQPDQCISVDYAPEPLQEEVVYSLNGVDYTAGDFPLPLSTSPDPYILTATISNRCNTLVRRDTFFVFGPSDPTILLPQADITVCRDTTLVLLETNTAGGTWEVDTGLPLVVQNGQTYFDTDQPPGDYLITYRQGFGDCEGEASRMITVQSPDVIVDGPWRFCENGPAEVLTANLPGGAWGGIGISDPDNGIFAPDSVPAGAVYEVFYTYTDEAVTGCTVTAFSSVEVVALPTAENVPESFTLCEVDAELSLPDLAGIVFDPDSGTMVWDGLGFVNTSSGTYNPALVNSPADTVRFVYTIDPGCTVRDTFVVSIEAITPVDAGPDRTICDSEENPTLTATPDGPGRWIGDGIDENTGELNLNLLTPGQTYQYIYLINEDFPPCTNSDTVRITIASGQGVSVFPSEIYLCDTASMVVLPAGSPTMGFWEGLANLSNDTLDLMGLTPDTFQLSYVVPILPAACNSAELTLYYSAQPTVGIANDSTACLDVGCLEFTAVTGGAEAFRWQFGDGSAGTGAQTCHPYSNTGVFTVQLTGYLVHPQTNQLYCASTVANTQIEILGPLAEVDIVASEMSACPDFRVDLSPSSADPRNTYTWTVAGIADSVATNINDVLLPATVEDTTYLALLTTTNGCATQYDSLPLVARAPLRAEIATDYDAPCSGDTISLYNRSTGTMGGTPRWIISNGIDYAGFEPPAFPVFSGDAPTILNITLIDSTDCNQDTAYYSIEIQPTDVRARMNYSSPTVCAGSELELINISTPGAPVRWVTSDGNHYDGDTVIHRFLTPGPAWVTIYAEGCGFDSTRYDFAVLPAPDLSLDFDPFACVESEHTFTVGGNAAGHILYYGNGDSTLLNISNYTYPMPGDYTLRLQGISTAGCVDSLNAAITIGGLPEAIVLPTDSVCVGEPVNLISQSIDAESCVWQLADGGSRDNCLSSYTFGESGLKNNHLVVTSSLGCTDEVDFPVYVRPTPTAGFSYVSNDDCSPAEVQFLFTNTTPLPTSWAWDLGDSTTATISNPFHTYNFGGSYPVHLIVGIDGICFDTLLQELPVRGTPRFDTLVFDERCLPTEAFVLEVITDEENEITLTGMDYSQAGINRFEIIPPGEYELAIVAPSGCDSTLTFTVPPVFPLEVQLMPDTTILLGASIQIVSAVNATDINLDWYPVIGLDDTSLLEPIATPGETTTYFLTISNDACTAIDTVTIFVDEEVGVYFPNAFSPNGDGYNDKYTFFPSVGVASISSFQIFNRWGGMVYGDQDIAIEPAGIQTWDGMLHGKFCNPGVFVYLAELVLTNGKEVQVKGSIHLVR